MYNIEFVVYFFFLINDVMMQELVIILVCMTHKAPLGGPSISNKAKKKGKLSVVHLPNGAVT